MRYRPGSTRAAYVVRHAPRVIAARPIVHRQPLVRVPTPEALLAALADRDRPVLAAFAGHVIVASDPIEVVTGADAWDAVAIACAPRSERPHTVAGGWIGLLGYDLGGTIERLPHPHPDPGGAPLASLGRYETVAVFDPYGGCVLAGIGSAAALRDLADAAANASEPQPCPPTDALVATSLEAADYRDRVQRARALIRAGDCYQVNLTQRLTATWDGSAMKFAAGLWAAAGPSRGRSATGCSTGTGRTSGRTSRPWRPAGRGWAS